MATNNTLQVKLIGSANSTGLKTISQLDIPVISSVDGVVFQLRFAIQSGYTVNITLSNGSYFMTSATSGDNLGTTKTVTGGTTGNVGLIIKFALGTTTISFDNKHGIAGIGFLTGDVPMLLAQSGTAQSSIYVKFDMSVCKYMTNLVSFIGAYMDLYGDLSLFATRTLSNFSILNGANSNVNVLGDIANLFKNNKAFAEVGFGSPNANIYGDLSALNGVTTSISYDLCAIAGQITGSISYLAGLTPNRLYLTNITGGTLTGDIGKLNASVRLVSFVSAATKLTFSSFTSRTYILAVNSGTFASSTDLDNFLIAQAALTLYTGSTGDYIKINVNGTRTSASDAAVTTIKGKGVTVIVSGVTQ
ncbi:hypothetical protein [Rhizosphaericola mali]|uniref:Uncharacterized protein n=1 Tax=Rhizosphaericola mali TaxID=2545455 RepID=A0A5P2G2D5_9BACT|nr:hypothetical protein [Rhizosphaericola mali]QES88878.1 hypothetical protein E0W69_009490 [Rhizosphaericola mali]